MAGDIWVISDTHFNHTNCLRFTKEDGSLMRPGFDDVSLMNETIIENWNSVVKPGDKVYHLGDVIIGERDWMYRNWPRLNGSKRLIIGNHDDVKFLSSGGFFKKVSMWRLFPEFGLLLTHVPVHQESINRKAKVNVHGHIHHHDSPDGPYANVCVERTDYTPINIEELRVI